ncbi:phytoene/squalene synthase family protein, partial [Streptomyces coelicoflavus]|nr:phytoene/squalene synthase family protein [Streptomyces coelicoflavus]
MTARELDAAGITDPELRAAYTRCRLLNARHGPVLHRRAVVPRRRRAAVAADG